MVTQLSTSVILSRHSHEYPSDPANRANQRHVRGCRKVYVKSDRHLQPSSELHQRSEPAASSPFAECSANVSRGHQVRRNLVRFRHRIFRLIGFRMYVSMKR